MGNNAACISFYMDGKVQTIDFGKENALRPTTTVLNYLRGLPGRKGTKEGCAEGDCGACTVVLAALDGDGKVRFRAFDSCLILLPMIHGKALLTVESIGRSSKMHPVQQAMVDTDGSQCGYCTPGFIMSLYALYKNDSDPDRAKIDDALTGNLCRCTGYRPIVEAAARACAGHYPDNGVIADQTVQDALFQLQADIAAVEIHREDQSYFRPTTLEEALSLRKAHPDAMVLCGATDIGLLVTKQKRILPKILDLSGLSEIRQVSETPEAFHIGAGVSLETVKGISETHFPALFDMLAVFGSVQIRNMATFGGNLGSASPIGDTPPVLMAYDATIVLTGPEGERQIPALDFVTGYRQTVLRDDELIREVILPKQQNGRIVKSYKISKRKDLDISTVSSGFRLDLNADNTVRDVVLVYGGMAAMTKRAVQAEDFLRGKPWSRVQAEAAMDLVEAEFTPISDARSSKDGRRVMARNLLLKFWADTQSS
ncbi:MAG: xanthine dehydrogenase small subunit [Bacteroidota bacterium]